MKKLRSFCVDNEDPVITCPANFNQSTDDGRANTTVTLPNATAVDNSLTQVTISSVLSGSVTFGIGSNNVTYTATDASGNAAVCNLTVTITGELAYQKAIFLKHSLFEQSLKLDVIFGDLIIRI